MMNGRPKESFGGIYRNDQSSQDLKQSFSAIPTPVLIEENKKLNIICREQHQALDNMKGTEEDLKRKIKLLLDENTKLNQALLQNVKLASNYNEIQKENQSLRHEIDELRNRDSKNDSTSVIKDLTQQIDLLLADNENLNKTLSNKMKEFEEFKKKIDEQQKSFGVDFQRQIKKLMIDNESLSNQFIDKENEIERNETEILSLKDKIKKQNANSIDIKLAESLRKQLGEKSKDIDFFENQIENKNTYIQKLEIEIAEYNEEIELLSVRVSTLEKQKFEKDKKSAHVEQNSLDKFGQELSKLSKELNETKEENERLKRICEHNDEVMKDVEGKLAELANENHNLNINLQENRNNLNHTMNERNELLQQVSDLGNELNNIRARLLHLDSNEKEIRDKDLEIRKLGSILIERKNDVDTLQEKIYDLEHQSFKIKELEDKIIALTSEKDFFRKIQIDYENLKSTTLKIPEMEYKIDLLNSDNERLSITLADKMKEIDSFRPVGVKMHALEDQISLLVQENDKTVALLESKADEIQKLERKLDKYADNEVKLLQEKDDLLEEIDDWKSRLNKLDQTQQRIKELEKVIRNNIEENEYLTDQVTEKVAETERVKKRLKDIEKLQKRITDLEDNNKFFHRENEELKSEIKDRDQEFDILKTRYQKIEARQMKYSDIEVKYNTLLEEWQDLRMEYELKIREINDHSFNKQQALDSELSNLKLEKMRWETSNHETTTIVVNLKNQVAELEINAVKSRDLESNVENLSKEKVLLIERIAELTNTKEDLIFEKVKISSIEEQIQGLSNENSHMRNIYENSLKDVEEWKSKSHALESVTHLLQDSDAKVNALMTENNKLKAEIDNFYLKLATLNAERDKLNLEIQSKHYENENLKAKSSIFNKSHVIMTDQTLEIDLLKAQLINYKETQSTNSFLSAEVERLTALLQQSEKLGKDLGIFENQIEQMDKNNKDLISLLAFKDKEIAEIKHLLGQEQLKYNKLTELENAIYQLSEENNKLNIFVSEGTRHFEQLKLQRNSFEEENKNLKANLLDNPKLKNENEDLRKKINDVQSKHVLYDSSSIETKNLRTQVMLLQRQLEDKLLEVDNLKSKLSIFENNRITIAELQNRISMLNTEIEKLLLENERLKANQNLFSDTKNNYSPARPSFKYIPQSILTYGLDGNKYNDSISKGERTPNSGQKNGFPPSLSPNFY